MHTHTHIMSIVTFSSGTSHLFLFMLHSHNAYECINQKGTLICHAGKCVWYLFKGDALLIAFNCSLTECYTGAEWFHCIIHSCLQTYMRCIALNWSDLADAILSEPAVTEPYGGLCGFCSARVSAFLKWRLRGLIKRLICICGDFWCIKMNVISESKINVRL